MVGMSDGQVAPGYESVRDAFDAAQAADDGAAQLAVYRDGRLVVDLWTGHDPVGHTIVTGDSITLLMSVTKGLVSTCAHILVERGQLDMDSPVTRYWPEFGDGVTIADLMTHRSGRSDFDPDDGIGMGELLNWDRCVTALAAMDPLWTPGSACKYHSLTWGYLVGEVIRRITGSTVGRFFADEIAQPLGLDLWIGLPGSADHRFLP
jgi:CubicO group peptidase (beta-lactamase class C family)